MKKSLALVLVGLFVFFTGHSIISITAVTSEPRMVQVMAFIGGLFRGVGVAAFLSGVLLLLRYKKKKVRQ